MSVVFCIMISGNNIASSINRFNNSVRLPISTIASKLGPSIGSSIVSGSGYGIISTVSIISGVISSVVFIFEDTFIYNSIVIYIHGKSKDNHET